MKMLDAFSALRQDKAVRRSVGLAAVSLALGVVFFVPIAALAEGGSPGKGQIGGPPTIPLGPPDEGKRTTPDFVIGRGDRPAGPAELVAYGWLAPRDSLPPGPREQFCTVIEYLPKEISPATCGPVLSPSNGPKAVIDSEIGALGRPAERFTEIGGRLTPDVASVRVSFRRAEHKRSSVMATVAQVAGELQRRLHQPSPFGYFDVKILGPFRFA